MSNEKCLKCDLPATRHMNSREHYCEDHYRTYYLATRCDYPYVAYGRVGFHQCEAKFTTKFRNRQYCTRHYRIVSREGVPT